MKFFYGCFPLQHFPEISQPYTLKDQPEIEPGGTKSCLCFTGIDNKRAALLVIGQIDFSKKPAIVEGIFHQPEYLFCPVPALGNDVIDAFIVVKTLGEHGSY